MTVTCFNKCREVACNLSTKAEMTEKVRQVWDFNQSTKPQENVSARRQLAECHEPAPSAH